MDQIVLNTNLRFIIAGLSLEERGLLLDALLEGSDEKLESGGKNIYQYIMILQQELAEKRQKMRELGAKGGAARKKVIVGSMGDLFDGALSDALATGKQRGVKRKEAKENNILNKKIKNLFISKDKQNEEKNLLDEQKSFVAPTTEEVRAFVEEEKLDVDAQTFVDFYESHGWRVGLTPIKNWRATVRLWHRRAGAFTHTAGGKKTAVSDDDETYWHELKERVHIEPEPPPLGENNEQMPEMSPLLAEQIEKYPKLSPFVRLMRRIENDDL